MTIEEISIEIVKRANKDFTDRYLLERAESYFRSACFSLLGGSHSEIDEHDYQCFVESMRLELGVNCFLPDDFGNEKNDILRLVDALYTEHENNRYAGAKVVRNPSEFGNIINNPLTKYSDISYVCLKAGVIYVYPFIDCCEVLYVRKPEGDDMVFRGDVEKNGVSLRFIYCAIDMASEQVKS